MVAIVDASALVATLVFRDDELDPRLERRMRDIDIFHVPDLVLPEFHNALRGLLQGKKIDAAGAELARRTFLSFAQMSFSFAPLADRAWELRHNFNPYDASYIALAEELQLPLITTDRKLHAPDLHSAAVEVYDIAQT